MSRLPAKNLRIATVGLGKEAAALLATGLKPKDVADILNDEHGEELAKTNLTTLSARDVIEYKEFLDNLEATQVSALVAGDAREKRIAARVERRIEKSLDLLEQLDDVARKGLQDFERGRELWDMAPAVHEYPQKQLNGLLRILEANRHAIDALHNDKGIQAFIKSAVVNVNQGAGLSQADIFRILRSMAQDLGIPEERVMMAWTDAQESLSTKFGPIDVKARA